MQQTGSAAAKNVPVLFSKSGYSASLREIAARGDLIELIDVPAELAGAHDAGAGR